MTKQSKHPESFLEIYDGLTLALDATAGERLSATNRREARSYMRAALRDLNEIMEVVQ